MHIDFLEFVSAKFILNLTFVQFFSGLFWVKIRFHIVYIMFQNRKFAQYLEQRHIQVGIKKKTFRKTKFIIE